MFNFRKKKVPLDVTTEEPRKSVSMEYASYTCLTTTKKDSSESIQVAVEKKEEIPCLDLDFKEENIVQAMVYSEIFSKPKSKRRKR